MSESSLVGPGVGAGSTVGPGGGVVGPDPVLFAHERVFNLGGIGVWEHDRLFHILTPVLAWGHDRLFDIGTAFTWQHDRPFHIGEVLEWSHDRLFDIVAENESPTAGAISTQVQAATTTLAAPASTTSTLVTFTSGAGVVVGSTVLVGSDSRTAVGVAGPVITLSEPPSRAWAAGTGVAIYAGTTTTASAAAGATSLTVLSATGLLGSTVQIMSGGVLQARVVTAVTGSVLTLASPLGSAVASGATVSTLGAGFVAGPVMVFDKNGYPLGNITTRTIPEPRSQGIRFSGQMQLQVPITHPDASLVKDDCLVAIASSVGLPLWGGSIGRSSTSEGSIQANCPDVGALMTGVKIAFTEAEMELVDATAATAVYQMVIDKLNEIRLTHGEVPFSVDMTGTKVFRGDLSERGEPFDYLELIARRSQTEWATSVAIEGGRLIPYLVVRDAFVGSAGVAFADGPLGNIEDGSIRYLTDPSTAIRKLKLSGSPSRITKYLPDWAHWAAHDVTPTVELSLPDPDPDVPGEPRFREDDEVVVDWGLSKAEQQRLAQLTEDRLWGLFYSYIYAWHDIMGMPYHPRWAYEGPPTEMESELTADKWRTHQELAFYRTTTYVHIVMVNEQDRLWLAVVYFASTEAKSVRQISMDELYKYPLPKFSYVPVGTVLNIYEVANKVARLVATYTWTDPAERWALYTSIVVTYGNRSMTVRGIVNGPFAGRYVNISEAPWVLGYPPEGPLIDDQTDFVTQVLGFERGAIQQWDPRRDGVGEYLSRPTVWSGNLTTRPRWHIVPYSLGDDVASQLTQGIYHYDTVIYVDNVDGWPTTFPYTIRVGDPLLVQEDMLVLSAFGGQLTVRRGTSLLTTIAADAFIGAATFTTAAAPDADVVTGRAVIVGAIAYVVAEVTGTTIRIEGTLSANAPSGTAVQFTTQAMLFETGAQVKVLDGEQFEGFEFPYEWPEGELYAAEWLERHRRSSRVIAFRVFNRGSTWASASEYRSTHTIDITTEGIIGGTAEVIAFSPDEERGSMEVIVELLP